MPKYTGVRRKGKKLYIRYQVNGQRREEPTLATTYKEADRIRAQRQAEADAGEWPGIVADAYEWGQTAGEAAARIVELWDSPSRRMNPRERAKGTESGSCKS